jgi:2',3'-cyclic-nucleotide 3'-phosphodiesterase
MRMELSRSDSFYSQGISLWLVPPSEDAEKLKIVMRSGVADKAQLPESSTSYPTFEPHITLASFPSSDEIPIETVREALPKLSSPITVDFRSIETGTHFFRSVFLSITQTTDLSTLHEHIHTTLDIKANTPLYPHLSLAYIDDGDALDAERLLFLRRLEDAGRVKSEGEEHVALNCFEEDGQERWISGFHASKVWIVRCEGPVEKWAVLDTCSLVDGLAN